MKKIISLIVTLSLLAAMAVAPAAVKAATYKYQVRGIGNGDVIVINEETSRIISVVSAENFEANDKDPVAATGIEKVEYYNDGELLATVTTSPYEYELIPQEFGSHIFKTIIYYTDGEATATEVFESNYTVIVGTKLEGTYERTIDTQKVECQYSFEEDFSENPESTGDDTLTMADIDFIIDSSSNISMSWESGKLKLSNSSEKSVRYMTIYPFNQDTTADVIYYHIGVETNNYILRTQYGKGSTGQTLDNQRMDNGNITVIVDLNSKYFILQKNGVEFRRIKVDDTKLNLARLQFGIRAKGNQTIDYIKCTSYDIKEPQSFSEASIQGGENNPVATDLAQIRVKGNDYLEEQSLDGIVTVDNGADFTPSIDGKDIVITFNQELEIGTTYTLTIDGVKDSDKLEYEPYTLTFRTLNEGENPPPQAELKSPADGDRYYPGDTITLSAMATDSLGGSISYVEFYCDGELIEGSRTEIGAEDVYTYEWSVDDTLESFEQHSITALACDNEGATVTTAAVKITVLSKQTPTVLITAPENGKSYAANFGGVKTDIKPTIKFEAADTDGEISLIEIFIDGDCVYSGAGVSQYTPETPLSAGNHSVRVYVTDNDGLFAYDEIELIVDEYGYTSYILREDLKNTELHSKYDKVGTVKSGGLSGFDDIKGIVITSDKPDKAVESSIKRTCIYSLEEKSFSVDVKVAFGDTNSERKVLLDTFVLYTFPKGGTYIPGEVYTVTALVDYQNLKLYTLLDGELTGTAQTIKTTSFTTDEVVAVTHTGGIGEYSETALLGIEISNMGKTSVQPEIVLSDADNPEYITVSFIGAEADSSTLATNLLLIDDNTGERVALSYQNGKFSLNEKLKYETDYTLVALPGVRDAAGKGYCGAYKMQFSTNAPEDAVGVADVGVSDVVLNEGTYTAKISVDFNGVGEIGESVNVVIAAYDGNEMIGCQAEPVTVGTALADAAIDVELSNVDVNTVIEVFVVDNLTDLNPISDRIFVIKQN